MSELSRTIHKITASNSAQIPQPKGWKIWVMVEQRPYPKNPGAQVVEYQPAVLFTMYVVLRSSLESGTVLAFPEYLRDIIWQFHTVSMFRPMGQLIWWPFLELRHWNPKGQPKDGWMTNFCLERRWKEAWGIEWNEKMAQVRQKSQHNELGTRMN